MNQSRGSTRQRQIRVWLSKVTIETIAGLIAAAFVTTIGYLGSQWQSFVNSPIPQILFWLGGFIAVATISVWMWQSRKRKSFLPPKLGIGNSFEEPWPTRLNTLQMLCRIGFYEQEGRKALSEGRLQKALSLFTEVLRELSFMNPRIDDLLSTIAELKKQRGQHRIAWSEVRLEPSLALEEISAQVQQVGDIRLSFSKNIVDELRQTLSRMEAIYQRAIQARQRGAWWRALRLFRSIAGYRDANVQSSQLVMTAVGGLLVVTALIVVIVSWPTRRLNETTATPMPTPTSAPMITTLTIICGNGETHTLEEPDEAITLAAVSAIFIELNKTPLDSEALTGTLLMVPDEERQFSYAPGGSGVDIITFTFVTDEETGTVVTKVLPITIIPERRGLCHP